MARPKKDDSSIIFEELEPRLLFSADIGEALAVELVEQDLNQEPPIAADLEAVTETESQAVDQPKADTTEQSVTNQTGTEEDQLLTDTTPPADSESSPSAATNDATADSETTNSKEIVFINDNIKDYEQLASDIDANNEDNRSIEVILLDSTKDGLSQVSDILSTKADLDAIHFITHGEESKIYLGNSFLDEESLEENKSLISLWGEAVSTDGDILFYGCKIASDDTGRELLDDIATITGADVAASEDITGHASFGGDWDLEVDTGLIETEIPLSDATQNNWLGALDTNYISGTNFGFELPATSKQTNWENVAGWSSDSVASDSGVEASFPNEGSWRGYLSNTDPSVWQLTSHDIVAGQTYELTVDSIITGVAGELTMRLYYDNAGSRTEITSLTTGLSSSQWDTYTLTFNSDDMPAAIGQKLGIEFENTVGTEGRIGLDDVQLSYSGTPSSAPSDLSNGIELNTDGGNDAHLFLNNTDLLNGLSAVTVETSFQISDLPGTAVPLLDFSEGGVQDVLTLKINVTGEIVFIVNDNATATTGQYLSLLDGDLHRVAASWDSTNGDYSIYADGELLESGTGLGAGTTFTATSYLSVGQNLDDAPDPSSDTVFNGTTHDVRVWSEVRSAGEIALNYQQKFDSSTIPTGLIANWQMDGLSGAGNDTVVDLVNPGINDLTFQHVSGIGFTSSTPSDVLNVDENSANSTSVGYIIPSAPEIVTTQPTNDVVNDGQFLEGGTPTNYTRYYASQSFGEWTVTSESVDLLGNSYDNSPLGGNAVDLGGGTVSDGGSGTISQTLATVAGQQYEVKFELSGFWIADLTTKDLRVSFGGSSQDLSIDKAAGWTTSDFKWEQQTLTFTADSSSTVLSFSSLDPAGAGPILGDIQVLESPTNVSTILINDTTLSYDAVTGKFYRFVNSPNDFNTVLAAAAASSVNGVSGQLVTIDSSYENDLVQQFVLDGGTDIWIGARDTNNDGNWNWLDGNVESNEQFWTGGNTGAAAPGFYAPAFGQSEGPGEDYARITAAGEWDDYGSDGSFAYLIEWDASAVLSNFTFTLTDDAGGRFAIDSYTGEITVADGSLLDYEVAASHDITAQVTNTAGESYSETLTIAVNDVGGEAPLNTVPGAQSTDEDTAIIFSTGNSNAISISDDSGDTPTVVISVSNGSLTVSGAGSATINGDSTATVTLSGTVADINAALNGLQYDPTPDYNGIDTLTITTTGETYALNVDTNLQGHYEFTSADPGSDSSPGGTSDGVIDGAVVVSDPERGDVLSFDGNDSVQISGMYGNPTDVTLAAWVNLTSADTFGADVISLGDNIILRLDANTYEDGVALSFRDGSIWQEVSTGQFLAATGWHHVAASYDDTNNTQVVYIDGIAAASANFTTSIIYDTGTSTQIGSHAYGGTDWDFTGLIDDARIYDRALSASEIAALASNLELSDTDTLDITVDAVNDLPVFDLDADNSSGGGTGNHIATFTEGDAPVAVIDSDVSITDVDNSTMSSVGMIGNFNGSVDGSAEIYSLGGEQFVMGTSRLVVVTQGSTDFELDFDGTSLQFGVQAGTGEIADFEALLATMTYEHTGEAPTAGLRSFLYMVSDADSGNSNTVVSTINVTAANDAPVLSSPSGIYPYTENAGAVVLGGSATVTDVDSTNFDGGQLVYQITANGLAEDRLDIRNQGTADGQIGIDGSNITYGGEIIGTYTGATTSNTQLIVSFNSSATVAAVEATLKNVTYENTSDNPTASTRTMQVYLSDGDGGTSNTLTGYVKVTPVNDPPVAIPDGVNLQFDGDDFILVSDAPSLQMADNVTLEAWIKPTGSGTGSQLILNKEGEYELGIIADTGQILFAITESDNTWTWHYTGQFVDLGEWSHVAVAYDGVAGEARTYINGQLVDTLAQSGTIGDVYPTFNDLVIGGRGNDVDERFDGQIDEVRVWNTTRTVGEIQSGMDGQLTGAEIGLVGNWRLDEAAGGAVLDHSSFGNNGVLGGAEGASSTPVYQGYVVDQNSVLNIAAAAGVLANDTDVEGNSLTVTNLDTSGILGNLSLNSADGSFSYDPNGAFDYLDVGEQATETFTYTANDGTADSNVVTVTITITGIEDAPTLENPIADQVATEDVPFSFTFASTTFTELDTSDSLSFTATMSDGVTPLPAWLTFVSNGDGTGTFSGTPSNGDVGTLSIRLTASDGTSSVTDTFDILVSNSNDAPVLSSPSGIYPYTENAGAVVLGGSATVTDVDSTNFDGGQLVYQITANGLAEDRLDIRNQGTANGQIGIDGSNITYGGEIIGTYTGATTSNTQLIVSFNSSATVAAVEATLKNVTYENTSDNPTASTRTMQVYLSDGDGGTSNTLTGYVMVTPVNDAPTISVTNSTPTFTENGSAVSLFSNTNIDPVETGDLIDTLELTVGSLSDGSDEILVIDGQDIALTHLNSKTTATSGYDVNVSVSGTTATVVISKTGGFSAAAAETLINNFAYNNTSENPLGTDRQVNLISIKDDGGGDDTRAIGISSLVTISAVNDDPTNDGTLPTDITVIEGVSSNVDLSSVNFNDLDHNNQLLSVVLTTSTGGRLYSGTDADVIVSGSGTDTLFLNGGLNDLNTFFNSASRIQYLHSNTNLAGDNADTIMIRILDNGNTGSGGGGIINLGTVNVDISNVNDAPAGANKTVTAAEDTDYSFKAADFGFTDANDTPADNLVSIITTTVTSNGSLYVDANNNGIVDGGEALVAMDSVLIADITDGKLKYKPTANGVGTGYDSFTFQVKDDGGTANSGADTDTSANTITIDVTAVNDTPVVSAPASPLLATEQIGLFIQGTGFGVSDVDDADAGAQAILRVGEGTLTVSEGNSGLSIDSGNGSDTIILTGTISQINNLLTGTSTGTITYFNNSDAPGSSTTLTVTVNDKGNTGVDPGLSGDGISEEGTANVTIDINAVDDLPLINDQTTALAENEPNTTLVINLNEANTSNDLDLDGQALTYSITAGNVDNIFAIDETTGALTVSDNTKLDYETTQQYVLTVQASDGTNSDTADITINVTNINENAIGPLSDSNLADNTIAENASIGTVVGITALATDDDLTDTVSYSVDDARFDIDASGIVTVAAGASFDAETEGSIDLTITAESTDGSTSSDIFTVAVTDINETGISAVTDNDGSTNTIAENATVGTTVGITALATDDDITDTVSYSVDDTRFDIDAAGVVTVAAGASFDAETEGSIDLTITAESTDGSTSSDIFTVAVTDINESAISAVTDNDGSTNTIAENATAGTTVGITALATDDDLTDTVSYTVDDTRFTIDAGGIVTVAAGASFDAETEGSIDLTITAESTDGSTSIDIFTIAVTDINESAISAVTDNDGSTNTIAENAVAGTTVGITAVATDDDITDTVSYSVDDARFDIDAGGIVTVAAGATFDAETEGSIDLTITAESSDGSTSSDIFTVAVTDINESAISAVTDNDGSTNTIAENATVGTTVGITALATDDDITDTVSYTVDDARFDIDAGGIVTVAAGASFDAETEGSIDLTITAESTDGSTSSDIFTVAVTDINESAISAVTDNDGSTNTIAENATVGTTVGITALATDDDISDNVSYSVDDARFTIDAGGIVTVAAGASFDAETEGSIDLTITAESTDGSTSSDIFTVAVTDINESAISAVSDNDGSTNTIAENATVGTTVGITALATDDDLTDTVSYTVDDARFDIDAGGIVTVAAGASFDAETEGSIDLTITAESTDGSTSSDIFTVAVTDINESGISAVTDNDGSTNTIAENDTVGTTVGITALATDDDITDTVSYSVDDARFTIDATGIVTVAAGASFDAETEGSIELTITAESTDGSTSSNVFTVAVTDINENGISAVTDNDGSTNTIAENATVGTTVGITALATDDDITDTVSYSVDDTRFTIDAGGIVTVAAGASFDAETEGSIDLTITAESTDGSTSSDIFTVAVTDINESAISAVTDNDGSTNTIAENASVGTTVGITALATDDDITDTVSYTVDDTRFDIDAGGIVTVAAGASFDAETEGSIDLTITAESTDGSTSSDIFTVAVTDINESAISTVADDDSSTNTIAENATAGTTVGITALATDDDITDTVSYTVDDARFDIDAGGIVTVSAGASFDAETEGSIDLTITAESTDGSTSSDIFTVAVTDINESAISAVTDNDGSTNTIAENATFGTTVGITALATDDDITDTISYTVDDNRFDIDASGIVTVAAGASFDAETEGSIDLIITAESTDGSTSSDIFTVAVTDINESAISAVTDNDGSTNTIAENATAGTTVGITALATDDDIIDTVSYSVDDTRFDIDASGIVTVAAGASFDAETEDSIDLTITAESTDGSTSSDIFTVAVTDINESAISAVTDNDGSINTIAENAVAGTTVGITALATDDDITDTVSYSVDDARFDIDAGGIVTVAAGATFDAETEGSIDLTITAESTDGSTSSDIFTVAVTDINETGISAVTDNDGSTNTIAENATVGTTVGITALATDDDITDTVNYSVDDARFTIDAAGVVTVAAGASFDAETEGSIDLTITAESTDGSTSSDIFTVAVTDINESGISTVTDNDGSTNTIAENATLGTTVGITALATDDDLTDTVSYTVDDARFDIDASGVVTVAAGASFDAETEGSIDLTITAESTDGSTSSDIFTVAVTDINESAISAVTDNDGSTNTIAENATAGTTVGITALATDDDIIDTVSYSVDDTRFDIDASGVVTVAAGASFDAETEGSIDLTITAESTDGSTSSDIFTVAVTDINETGISAVTDNDSSTNTIAENATVGTTVGITALATDDDITDTVSYSVDDTRFTIDAAGIVTVAAGASFDAETEGSIDLTITAESTDGSTSSDIFTVAVTDINETGISAVTDNDGSTNTIAENATVGTTVGITALATDDDITDTVSYSVDDARFTIDAAGVVTVAAGASFDAETEGSIDLTITAESTDGSTSSDIFTVAVTDINESGISTVTDNDGSTNTIAENATAGTTVGITALATDNDITDTVSYSVDDARFDIDAGGIVTVASGASFDAETEGSINLTITAESTDGSTSSDTFTVAVTDINESAISAVTDNDGSPNTIAENATAGTTVGITALATDDDITDTVSYSVDDARFTIDAGGIVTVAAGASFDAETEGSIDLTITAESTDGSTSSDIFTVAVTDINESGISTVTDNDGSTNTIAENATEGTAVGITALATDDDLTDTVSYSVDDTRFDIDAGGIVTVAAGATFDAETESSINLTITAESTDGTTSNDTFTIAVTDINESAISTVTDIDGSTNTIAENATAGTTVGITALATDNDITDTVSYSVDDARFDIDAAGVVTVAADASFDAETEGSIDLTITAESTDGSTSSDIFTVAVTDINESAISTVTDNDGSTNTIAENATAGTTVGITALATDNDITDTVSYSVDDARFTIDAAGVVTIAAGASFDAETEGSIDLTITAESTDGSTSSDIFTVAVTDINESGISTVTDNDGSTNTIAENATLGTTVGITALATDDDLTDTVSYTVDDARFDIDASGVVTVAAGASFDAETEGSIDLTITAESTDGSTSSDIFTVAVTDINESAISTVADDDSSTNTIAENATVGTTVGITALATDDDITDTVSYSVDDARFTIDAAGVVTVAAGAGFDAETENSIDLTITAESTDGSTSSDIFTVAVTDINETGISAVTDNDGSTNTIAENATVGTTVGITALATDDDSTDTVSYSVDDTRFTIDAGGIVTVAAGASFDAETEGSIDLTITAESTDGSTSSDVFTVSVTDINESGISTVTDNDGSTNTIAENATVGTTVGITALATDDDITDTVSYTVDDARFTIDAGGVVTVAAGASFDAETEGSIDLTITAESTDGSTSGDIFTVAVTDINESAISAVTDNDGSTNTIAENATVGTTVGITALATDDDITDTVSYSVDDARFTIDAGGIVTVAAGASFDAETEGSIDLTITAESTDGSTSSDIFTVAVTDINESGISAVTDNDGSSNTIAENAVAGTTVGITALATDNDITDTISYTIDDARFTIDAGGIVTVAAGASFDAETEGSIDLTITAESTDGSTSSDIFTVAVTDINESAISAVTDNDGSTNTIAENATVGTTVGITALATDDDITDTVSYSVDDARFDIDAGGIVTVAPGASFDAETENSIDLTITAESTDGSTSSDIFTVAVTDINESGISAVTDNDGSTNTIAENATVGTTVGITALATDNDITDTVSYSVDDARFDIDEGGIVTVAAGASFDAETEGSIDLTITAESTDGSTSSDIFTVAVTDINESAISAVTDNDGSTNTIAENATAGTTVGITALATDNDITDTVSYTIDDARFTIDAGGIVTVAAGASFDAETEGSIDLTITAESTDGSTSSDIFTVAVTDINEAGISAVTDNDGSTNTIAENATVGTTVGITALATDDDITDTVSYSVDDARFDIDASGIVAVAAGASFDAETEGSIDLTITAESTDGSTSSDIFTVAVTDFNEAAISAVIDNDGATNTIAENATAGTTVGITALATDDDITDTVSYTVDDTRFDIDASGIVTVAAGASFDAETEGSIDLTITAESTDGSTSSDIFTVAVTDINESAISAVTDNDGSTNTIAENATVGTTLGITALATDNDITDTVSYSVDDARFDIDAGGVVTVAAGASFDAETEGSIDLTITAESTDGSTSSDIFTVAVTDINESAISAVTDNDGSTNTIAENATAGTTVGITALATDNDITDTVSYTIDDARFTIDAGGIVTVAAGASFDAETEGSIDLTITAESTDGSTSSDIFTVAVTDINESAISAVTDNDGSINTIAENAAAGTTVGIRAFASDDDITDTVTYSLSNSANGLFTINQDTGVISVVGPLDYETSSSHLITVVATSSDSSTSSKTLRINIGDVNDTPVTTDPNAGSGTEELPGTDEESTSEQPLDNQTTPDADNQEEDNSLVAIVKSPSKEQEASTEEETVEKEKAAVISSISEEDNTVYIDSSTSEENFVDNQNITYIFDGGQLVQLAKKPDASDIKPFKQVVQTATHLNQASVHEFSYPTDDSVSFNYESSEPDWFEVDHKSIENHIELMQDEMDQAFEEELQKSKTQMYLTGGASVSLAAGAVSYLLRAGSLMSSFLATVPIWKGFDPVAILINPDKKAKKSRKTVPDTPHSDPAETEQDVEKMFNEQENKK